MAQRSKINPFGTIQGEFKPTALNKNGEKKFRGKRNPIYRSSYELQCFYLLEQNPGILWWQSEASTISYTSPLDGRKHRYFIDLTFRALEKETGEYLTFLVEVKPKSQTIPPVMTPRKRKKTFETEAKRYLINKAKWDSAHKFAKQHGYKFFIWTEVDMFEFNPNN